jgi:4-hydroxy-L-threonine phosphate dehydrogenase PdxA
MTVTARIALPVGDPNGIGPEIALRAAAAYAGRRDVQLTLFGPEAVLQQTADRLGLAAVLQTAAVVATEAVAGDGYTPGRVCAEAGAAMIAAASTAITAARCGEFDAVVAGPHHETAVHLAGIPFRLPLAGGARVRQSEDSVFLLLVGGGLHIVHATLHESVQHALDRLTPELVVQGHAGRRARYAALGHGRAAHRLVRHQSACGRKRPVRRRGRAHYPSSRRTPACNGVVGRRPCRARHATLRASPRPVRSHVA